MRTARTARWLACGLAVVCSIGCDDAGVTGKTGSAPAAPPAVGATRAAPTAAAPAASPAPDGPAAAPSDDDLVGLWTAQRSFSPIGPQPLVIERRGGSYTADLVGRLIPLTVTDGALAFELPGGDGSFRGAIEAGRIRGHWITPRTISHGSRFASPVDLAPDGPDRWRGTIVPFDDVFTFHLRVERRPDGTLGALLRNPERDFGAWLGVTRLEREAGGLALVGKRGDAPERVVAGGSFDPESGVLSLRFPSRGGTHDFQRTGDDSGFYPRGRQPARYAYRPPPRREDGWPTATLDRVNIDRAAIERFVQSIAETPIDAIDSPEIHGFLIARHGALVLEEYFHGEHRDRLHETRSAAKSLTAVVVGAAMQAGADLSPSTPVYPAMMGSAVPADLDPRKRAMTLEHLLTMSAGFHCDDTDPSAPGNEDAMQEQREQPDWLRFTLDVPMISAPGERSVYCSSEPNLALGVLARATGKSPLDLFDRYVARPLGIERYGWPLDGVGNAYGGGGVKMLPRDFMKLGQVMLDGGRWRGRTILSRQFVARASSPLQELRGIHYGYLWWVIDYPYKDRTVRAFFAGGSGGQGVTVFPALDLVVASYAGNYSSKGTINTQQNLVARYLLPAVREPGDDPAVSVPPREDYVSPYGRTPVR